MTRLRPPSGTSGSGASVGYKTRNAIYSFGGGGGASSVTGSSLSNLMGRMPLRLPVTPSRFRIHVANRDRKSNAAGTAGSYTFTDMYIGPAALDTSGLLNGAFTTTPTRVLTAFTTDLGTDYVSGWIDTSTITLAPHTDYLLSYGYSCSTAQTTQRSTGRMFYLNGASPTGVTDQVGVVAPASMNNNDSPQLEWWIEYEFDGVNHCRLYIGDSLTDGYKTWGGPRDGFPGRVSHRTGVVSMVNAYTGINASSFAGATTDNRWGKYTGITVDSVHICLGTNDINGGASLATVQGYLATIVANARSLYGSAIPIYLATIPPRNLTTTPEGVRTSVNTWLRSQPFGVAGVTDLDRAVRATGLTTLDADFDSGDGTHPNSAGADREASVVPVRVLAV